MSNAFYRPQGGDFNGWKFGENDVAIVNVTQLEGEELQRRLASKSQYENRDLTGVTPDVNLVVEVKKEGYEYTKKNTYLFCFYRDKAGNLEATTKEQKRELAFAWEMLDCLFAKPKLGINQQGKIITEAGKEINLPSYFKMAINPNKFNYKAFMVKGGQYWNIKLLAQNCPESIMAFQKQADYLNTRFKDEQPNDNKYQEEDNTDFPFGENVKTEDDNPFI